MGRGDKPPKARTWVIEANPETGILSEDEIALALGEAALIVDRVGGVVQLAAHREEIPEEHYGLAGIYATRGLIVRWESYAPAKRAEHPPQEPAEGPLPDYHEPPVAAATG